MLSRDSQQDPSETHAENTTFPLIPSFQEGRTRCVYHMHFCSPTDRKKRERGLFLYYILFYASLRRTTFRPTLFSQT